MKNLLRSLSSSIHSLKDSRRGDLSKTSSADSSADPTVSSADDSSCCSVEDFAQDEAVWMIPQSPTKRKVTFGSQILCYNSPWVIIRGEPADEQERKPHGDASEKVVVFQKSVWYTRNQVSKFKNEVQVYASQREKQKSTSKRSWSHTLHRVYRAFVEHDQTELIERILEKAPTADPLNIGLEKFFYNLGATRGRQRKSLYTTVQEAQKSGLVSERELRRMCRELSRPSLLFAIYLARTVKPNESEIVSEV